MSADKLPWAHCPQDNSSAEIECSKASATVYYWYREALDASPSIEQPGVPRWWIVLYLLLAWIIVFFIVMKGIQSSGKVSTQLLHCFENFKVHCKSSENPLEDPLLPLVKFLFFVKSFNKNWVEIHCFYKHEFCKK